MFTLPCHSNARCADYAGTTHAYLVGKGIPSSSHCALNRPSQNVGIRCAPSERGRLSDFSRHPSPPRCHGSPNFHAPFCSTYLLMVPSLSLYVSACMCIAATSPRVWVLSFHLRAYEYPRYISPCMFRMCMPHHPFADPDSLYLTSLRRGHWIVHRRVGLACSVGKATTSSR